MSITIGKSAYNLQAGQITEIIKLIQDVRSCPGASATYDPPSVAAGAQSAATTITVTGARAGDFCSITFSLDRAGTNFIAWVSANDTVSFAVQNPTAGTVDLASGTVTVHAIRVA